MANRMRGEADFVHDDRKHTIVIDAEVLLQVEDATGVSLFDMKGDGGRKLGFVAALLRFGLARGCGIELDRGEAAEMVMLDKGASEAVMTALNRALPEQKEGVGGNPPKAARKRKAGTGTGS